MAWMSVHLYRANNNDQKWIDKAQNALQDLEDQVNFSVFTYDEGNVSVNVANNYGDTLDNWAQWLDDNDVTRSKYDYHMLLVNTLDFGAGVTRGKALGPKGSGNGVIGLANAAVRFDNDCYGGNETFPPTVMHEVIHSGLHDDMDKPDPDTDHSLGDVGTSWPNIVTPIQLWYTGDVCSGNAPPDDNCNNNPGEEADGVTHDISSCTEDRLEDYMNSW